eukprot:CAMPEP_0184989894 /NCGR_PEP_ID=MMETSP1098-20130426/30544_1 /TAXON_ID=89044 /ORGANISM="Spumella elongata, Strain CCAP 955/1" /LENGTH=574 /DNA_ID=CAMNT_0027514993 /DNA_START=129 /DNA_END=1853 /DNA_ORIENTATION=+
MASCETDGTADAKDVVMASAKKNRLKGMKIRDEFICPITYELMRDPVVASDGHTYEKAAIEKWLKNHKISPRSGEPMDVLTIPNINIKKLIQDIINEGGHGFYMSDISNKDRMFEVRPEKILVLECLGPPESDWNSLSFQVNRFGCIGGRKHNPNDNMNNREPILFKDITVSRRHFEITNSVDIPTGGSVFHIRDLGSAGGTFIRIPHGKRKQLHPGMIILLGKHQFTISSVDDAPSAGGQSFTGPAGSSKNVSMRKSSLNSEAIMSLVENAEKIISDFAGPGAAPNDELSERLKNLTMQLSSHLADDAPLTVGHDIRLTDHSLNEEERLSSPVLGRPPLADGRSSRADHKGDKGGDDDQMGSHTDNHSHHHHTPPKLTTMRTASAHDMNALHYEPDVDFDADAKMTTPMTHAHTGGDAKGGFQRYTARRCTLTCCAPDGSPLQGHSFIVDKEGAMMGRKATNTIPLLMKIEMENGEERVMNVDTAISSEHARIEFEPATGQFFICDGTVDKPSTNGTWFRLSGPHQESSSHVLSAGVEVLIGTVRFLVSESMTISEHGLDSKGISNSFSEAAK